MLLQETIPIPTPTYVGETEDFLKRMSMFVRTFPDIFWRMKSLRLDRAYIGLRGLRFVERMERGSDVLAYYDASADVITVYPMNFRLGAGRIDIALYTGFGERYWHQRIQTRAQYNWNQKYVHADRKTMDRLRFILTTSDTSYNEIVNKFSLANERLQVIHVLDALIANNISRDRAKILDIFIYPPTAPFCNGNTPYTLNPLLSVYYGPLNMREYWTCFSKYCVFNGRIPCTDLSVESSLNNLFKTVTFETP
jgi:hypothetical protein